IGRASGRGRGENSGGALSLKKKKSRGRTSSWRLNRDGARSSQNGYRHILSAQSVGAVFFFFQAEDGIRDGTVTGVQTCALPISAFFAGGRTRSRPAAHRIYRQV